MMKKIHLVLCIPISVLISINTWWAYTETDINNAQFLATQWVIVDQTNNPNMYRFPDTITRAELIGVSLLMNEVDIPEEYRCRGYYDDVDKNITPWICRAVELAADERLITKQNDLFRPQAPITRAEAYAILLDASDLDYESDPDFPFQTKDSDIVDWQKKLYARLIDLKIPIPDVDLPEITESGGNEQDILFPVQGNYGHFVDSFGDPRWWGRTHIGTDISAPKMTPLVAVVDGTITFAPRDEPYWWYALYLKGDNGYTYKYLHLNNDTPGTDDGNGGTQYAYGPGIKRGTKVKQGDIIAYAGDSGNAESIGSHLHFEISAPDKTIINPYQTLKNAEGSTPSVTLKPNAPVTRSEVFSMAAFLMKKNLFE